MSKGYKKEYLDKVKQKFNDLQSSNIQNKDTTAKPSIYKRCEIRNPGRMDKLG